MLSIGYYICVNPSQLAYLRAGILLSGDIHEGLRVSQHHLEHIDAFQSLPQVVYQSAAVLIPALGRKQYILKRFVHCWNLYEDVVNVY